MYNSQVSNTGKIWCHIALKIFYVNHKKNKKAQRKVQDGSWKYVIVPDEDNYICRHLAIEREAGQGDGQVVLIFEWFSGLCSSRAQCPPFLYWNFCLLQLPHILPHMQSPTTHFSILWQVSPQYFATVGTCLYSSLELGSPYKMLLQTLQPQGGVC